MTFDPLIIKFAQLLTQLSLLVKIDTLRNQYQLKLGLMQLFHRFAIIMINVVILKEVERKYKLLSALYSLRCGAVS